jgi:hypothetical protein
MSPTDLEEKLYQDPFVPFRLTLASGDQVVIDNPRHVLISNLSLHYLLADEPTARVGKQVKIISIPNIVLVETIDPRRPRNGRGRR